MENLLNKRTRKRKSNTAQWKKNVRKRLRQSGLEYTNTRGNISRGRISVRKCLNCRFKCSKNFTEAETNQIHEEFWKNTDDDKGHFYDKTTERCLINRERNRHKRQRTKQYSYKYFFKKIDKKIRVCKKFYLGVLDISQIRISYFYTHKREGITNTPSAYTRGSNTEKRIKNEHRQIIRDHINMFPRIPSHYCRSTSAKEYLERTLTLSKMYDLYVEYCNDKQIIPQKKWLYYNIFNYEFNIGFHAPKKDLCDICSEYDTKKKEDSLCQNLEEKYSMHVKSKLEARHEKQRDILICRDDPESALICFDMQSVLTCPQTQISKAYYKKKYSVYNLTGNDVVKKKGYCILWHELLGGRKGVDIASALYVMIEKILEGRPEVTKLILWSDSCVPQNKNSHMSAALFFLMKMHPEIKSITQKFQVPGHSCVQEVDAMHSVLDRTLNKLELHSPLAIFKAIKNTRTRNPYRIVQMQKNNFLEFKALAKCMNLSQTVPYKSLIQILYENKSHCLQYKLNFGAAYKSVNILKQTRQGTSRAFSDRIPNPKVQALPPPLPEDKVAHIRSLSNHFSAVDLEFWQNLIINF